VEKARYLLGWKSEVSVEEGLKRCVEWYQANLDIAQGVNLGER
jgi:UDP-glucuronate 4-epimerase